jgi:RNA polymerase sigma-70 factor (ECF subfamily)
MLLEESTVDIVELAALGRMFEEHRLKLLAMLRQRIDPALASRLQAEDVLADAFLRAKHRWPDFQQSGMTAYAWLYRLVLDCLYDTYDFHAAKGRDFHREVRMPDGSSSQFVLGLVDRGSSPSKALARKELQEKMRQTLALLRPEEREILCMRHVDELSLKEAAHVLDIAEGTARQRYARARLRLRDLWKKLHGDEEQAE